MPEEILEAIDEYYKTHKLVANPKPDKQVILPTNYEYHSQFSKRPSKGSQFVKDLQSFFEEVSDLHRNLNYQAGEDIWKEFYTFPNSAAVKKYCKSRDIAVENIVNLDDQSVDKYAERIIEGAKRSRKEINADQSVNLIKFLLGTTGVGKTTFLKYFQKTQKETLITNGIISSRIKYRDLENTAEEKSINAHLHAMESQILDCLYRDIVDACKRVKDGLKITDSNLYDKISKIRSELDDIALDIAISSGINDSKKIDSLLEDLYNYRPTDIAITKQREHRLKLIRSAHREGMQFLMIFDGFDAINPSHIKLFDHSEAQPFFACLSLLIRGAFVADHDFGQLVNSLNKTFIIAVRPITITQLKVDVQIEAEFDHEFDEVSDYVVGTDIMPLLKKRLKALSKIKTFGEQSDGFYDAVIAGLNKVNEALYQEYKSVKHGRLIDLFNHNIREKIIFLKTAIKYILQEVLLQYNRDRNQGLVAKGQKLDSDMLIDYLNGRDSDLQIQTYEIERLLILNETGTFKNYYRRFQDDVIPENIKGPFDNIFNYLDNIPHKLSEDNRSNQLYNFRCDPILDKIIILSKTKREEDLGNKLGYRELQEWFKANFKSLRLCDEALKVLIRGAFIEITENSGDLFIHITRKGRFVLAEMLYSLVYLEHACLNVMTPKFIGDMLGPPKKIDSSEWGKRAIINVTLFLKYIKTVSEQSLISEGSSEFNIEIFDNMYDEIKKAFRGIILKGLSTMHGEEYRNSLIKGLRSIGVRI